MADNVMSIDALRVRPVVEVTPAQPRPVPLARAKGFLDRAAAALHAPERVPEMWPRLLEACAEFRAGVPEEVWRGRLRAHPIFDLLRADPAVDWSYRKPRGHAGDARLMDFLYDHPTVRPDLAGATPHGQALHRALLSGPTATAARACRVMMAEALDHAASCVQDAQVLVLGAGHLREAELARDLDRLGRLVALDQDPACGREIEGGLAGRAAIQVVTASVRRFLPRIEAHGRFDLIQAAGLFDYLDDDAAERTLRALVPVLRPGGRLLFTNSCPGVADEAYLDAFMDWRMFRRDAAGLRRLLQAVPRLARTEIRADAGGAVLYATVEVPPG